MENEPAVHIGSTPDSPLHIRYWLKHRLLLGVVVLVVVALGYVLISALTNTTGKDGSTEKVLSISDLDNPNVELDSKTSDASVENLTKVLKAKIDKQIATKENPFETV